MKLLKFAIFSLAVILSSCGKDKKDNQVPVPEEEVTIVKGVLQVKYFDVSSNPVNLKIIEKPDPGYAKAIFFDQDGNYVDQKDYNNGEFSNEIEYELAVGKYKFIIFVADDMDLYTIEHGETMSYDKTNVYLKSLTEDQYIWYNSGEFTVSQNKSEADEATVTCPLGMITLEITNESFSDKWKSVKTRILPMGYTPSNNLNTVCAIPGTENYSSSTASHDELCKTVEYSENVKIEDLNFSSVLLPYSGNYQVIFEIENSVDNSITEMRVENIPIIDDENTTLKGKLVESVVNGSYQITIEEVNILPGTTIEF